MSTRLPSSPRLRMGRIARAMFSRRRRPAPGIPGVHRSRARYALGHVLGELGLPRDSVALIPSFVCASVVMPFLDRGFEIRAYPVTAVLEPDLARLGELVDRRTRVVLGIRYFGSSAGMEDLAAFCRRAGLVFVEDCAHLLPYDPAAAAAEGWGGMTVYSWRKHLPVPDGGSVFLRDPSLLPNEAGSEDRRSAWVAVAADLARHYAGGTALWRRWVSIRARVRRAGTFRGEDGGDSASAAQPEDFRYSRDEESVPMRPSSRFLLERLDVRRAAEARREHARHLADRVGPLLPGPCLPDLTQVAGGPWALAIRTPSRPLLQHRLRRAGIPAFGWDGVVHPVVAGQLEPESRRLYDEFCFLPVHQDLRPGDLRRIETEVCRALQG